MITHSEPKTAAEWTARLRGTEDPQIHADYERWLEADPENRESAEALDRMWESIGALEDDPLVQDILAAPPRRKRGFFAAPLAAAPRFAMGAAVAMSLVAAFFFARLDAVDAYETTSGEQRVVDLADGSRLHLNVSTKLEVDLDGDVRSARLTQGQAFFEIAPDPKRPFVVAAGDKEITVLGTKFDVLVQDGDTRVTVLEGRVAVTSLGGEVEETPMISTFENEAPAEPAAKQDEAPSRLELVANDAVYWPRSASPSPLAPAPAIASVEAWRSGKVVFDKTPLAEAIVELDRYTPMGVRLGSGELAATAVSGVFYVDRLADVDSLVFALENSLPIVVERRENELLLTASERLEAKKSENS